MGEMIRLEYLKSISIEIGPHCNLSKIHKKCPASILNRDDNNILSLSRIIEIMDEAARDGFCGYFAFHFYNEPLLYIDRIEKIIKQRPNYKYMLWSNGTLIKHVVDEGFHLDMFDKIIITKYPETSDENLDLLKGLDVTINEPDMDDRLLYYESRDPNYFSCKKLSFELPIDCYGNVYICTYDWKGKYILGNVVNGSLIDILATDTYKGLFKINEKYFIHGNPHDLCKYCPRPLTNWPGL